MAAEFNTFQKLYVGPVAARPRPPVVPEESGTVPPNPAAEERGDPSYTHETLNGGWNQTYTLRDYWKEEMPD